MRPIIIYIATGLCFVFSDVALILLKIVGWFMLGAFILLLIGISIVFFKDALMEWKLTRFRKKYNGQYFLMYGSRKKLKVKIEEDLKPALDVNYKTLYFNGQELHTSLSDLEINYLLLETNTVKFPRLVRIGLENIDVQSFYSELSKLSSAELNAEDYKKEVTKKLNKLKK